ncbi:hypothetical protein G6F40_016194 [Rhizopus arrhizus]|nr:hypothetical protein G6F40_016194 [Rhizopus arrhizus]
MPLFVAQRLLPDIRAYGYDPAVHASLPAGSARRTAVVGQRGLSRPRAGVRRVHAPTAARDPVAAHGIHRLSRAKRADAECRAAMAGHGQPASIARRSRRRSGRRLWPRVLAQRAPA